MSNLEKSDRKLLGLLQKNVKTTIPEMSEKTGMSTATVQRRLKNFREAGVVQSEVAVLDPLKVGLGVKAIVSVELERDRSDQIDIFKRKAREDAQVQHCYCIAGDADFLMIVVARDMADYERFTHRFFFSDSNVRKFRTSIVVSTEKATLELPL
ncbi:Lrp/AsnC family transcriptional regulator [Kushneria aurantia]|uniref:Lrp/AsnC family transcriptional regulator n=1 Tax=Kushneria aurantia TaxID=504092 RepID=A0ABV6G709_9GAMM|nr:Lrp/AsnC family transcriptional regulator [Kushneria aurantia]